MAEPLCTKCQERPAEGEFLWCASCREPGPVLIEHRHVDGHTVYNEPVWLDGDDGRAPNHPDFQNATAFALTEPEEPLVSVLREMVHDAIDDQIGTTYGQAGNPGQLIVTRYEDYSQARWTGELDGDRTTVIASLHRFLGGGA